MSKHDNNKCNLWKSIFIIIISFSAIAVVTFVTYHPKYLYSRSSPLITSKSIGELEVEPIKPIDRLNRDSINILLLGFDRSSSIDWRYDSFRPDTIMIVRIDFNAEQVSLVSIPRDSYVKIHSTDIYDKINHSYMYGYLNHQDENNPHKQGIMTTLWTVQDFLGGVPIHNYIALDMEGASNIIDEIGGLYYEVDVAVYSKLGKGSLLLDKGYQLLDGKGFINYIRNRSVNQGGESGRIERQQKIIIELFNMLMNKGRLSDIPELYMAVRHNIETDLNFNQITALSLLSLKIKPEEIKSFVFSGHGQLSYRNGQNIWYLVIDELKRIEIINDIFGYEVSARSRPVLPDPLFVESEDFADRQELDYEPETKNETTTESKLIIYPNPDEDTEQDQDILEIIEGEPGSQNND